jgi:lipopolysaccharide/colanic/teichoic acid biosynthesis glycosyltransferase
MYAPRHGLCPVAVVLDDDASAPDRLFRVPDRGLAHIAVTREPISVSLLHAFRCELLIVAAPRLSAQQIEELRDIADQARSSIAVLHERTIGAEWIDIDGLHLLSNIEPITAWHCGFARRVADVALSLALLVLLAPLMLLIIVLIRIDSPGPVLFLQERVGKNGQIFRIFKFRSLHVTAPAYDRSPTQPDDPRITRMGRLLRRAGLDELPQLFNVLLGQMSLVGPRPEMPFLVDQYRSEHRPRLQVTPGITGLWQLSADRALPIHENTQYDLYYIRNRTLCMDWAILIHTLFFALRGGA